MFGLNVKFFMLIMAFALVASMVSSVKAQLPTLLWSDPVATLDIAVSKDGQYVASVADPIKISEVCFYGRNSGTPLWTYSGGGTWYSVAISADGDCVVAGNGSLVAFWKGAASLTGSPVPLWTSVYVGSIDRRCLGISDDGNYVVACGTGEGVYYWAGAKAKSGSNVAMTWTYYFPSSPEVLAVDLSSDGNFVVAGTSAYSGPSKVAYWKNARSLTGSGQTPNWASTEAGGNVPDVAVSDDGNYVAVAAYVDTVHYWANAQSLTGDPSSTWYGGSSESFTCIDMSSGGGAVIAGASNKVYFWGNAKNLLGRPQAWSWTYTALGTVHDVTIDDAGDYMAAANDFATPYVYFLDNGGHLLWDYGPLADEVYALSISSDGGTLAAGTGSLPSTAYLLGTGYSTPTPQPVGGIIVPTDTLAVTSQYVIALVVAACAITAGVAAAKKRST